MSLEQHTTFRYSEAFKMKVISEIESGKLTANQARQNYDIGGGSTIKNWIKKYGKNKLLSKVVRIEMKDEKDKLKQLEKEKKALESALAQAQLKILCMESMIEVAKDDFDFDIKKILDDRVSKD